MTSVAGDTGGIAAPALSLRGIRKQYPGVLALDGVDLEVRAGEVHVLLGENGAGKSTLMKIVSGAQECDSGTIAIHGQPLSAPTPKAAREAGVGIIYQELTLVPGLSAAENIFLGRAPSRFGVVNHRAMETEARSLFQQLRAEIDPASLVSTLSLAQQQLVEIARALSLNARVLIMDEPTSALTDRETSALFDTIRTLTSRGVAIVYISHRLDEIFAIGDRVTVLRDGRHIATCDVATANRQSLVQLMANREVSERQPARSHALGGESLRVRGLTRRGVLHDVHLTLHAGEVVGMAGLLGAGRTELARAIFGLDRCDSGELFINGAPRRIRSPRDAIAAGIGFVTEDRKKQGLVLGRSVRDNVALTVLSSLGRYGVVNTKRESTLADDFTRDLRIRTPSIAQLAGLLSGGNQQKVVLAKWLATGARVLILDEPTRGIDVGAKQELYQLINRLAADGVAILLISSDLPEVMELADRTIVMRGGRVAGEFLRADTTAERLMACAVGA